ncbi:MAG: Gfo/Idh/MocA family protein, partial [bacterium]
MIKIGILGANLQAERHVNNIRTLDNVRIAGLFDKCYSHALKFSIEKKVKLFESFDELLQHVDAVDITVPGDEAYFFAIESLKNSKHLYLSNPFLFDLKRIKNLVKLANEANVKIQVNRKEKFNPIFSSLAQLVNDPKIIQIQRHIKKSSRELLKVNEYLFHDLEIVLQYLHSPVKRINTTGIIYNNTSAEVIQTNIEFRNEAIVNIHIDNLAEENSLKASFYQPNGIFHVDFSNNKIIIN